jgi:hypothetical protein
VFNCSVLTFWSVIKFHREIEPANSLQYKHDEQLKVKINILLYEENS